MNIYRGKVRLKSGGQPIDVSVTTTSNQNAKKAIEAQYSGQLKSWFKQMSRF